MLIALLRSPNGNGISDAVKRLKASYPDWRPPFSNEDGFLQIFWPELPEVVRGIPYNDHRRQELFIELFMALRQKKIFGYVFLISSPPTHSSLWYDKLKSVLGRHENMARLPLSKSVFEG